VIDFDLEKIILGLLLLFAGNSLVATESITLGIVCLVAAVYSIYTSINYINPDGV
jgi:hypothetical protein